MNKKIKTPYYWLVYNNFYNEFVGKIEAKDENDRLALGKALSGIKEDLNKKGQKFDYTDLSIYLCKNISKEKAFLVV
jgi:hypothetical protein